MRARVVIALAVAGSAAFAQLRGQELAYASAAEFDAAEVNAPSDVVEFLLTTTDARLRNIEEGSIASKNGGSKEIKDYAEKVINDQRMMLGYIKKMALLRGLILPDDIGEENRNKCERLAGLSGKKLDKKYIKMLINDRERDLELFRKAVNSSDVEVRQFAELYIPIIEKHLKKAKALKRLV